jgi:ubiquinone/menaquinone biosynthesis C-methylase UbiE
MTRQVTDPTGLRDLSGLHEISATIPSSPSDELLGSWGYDLVKEYVHVVSEAAIQHGSEILELATGTGRMTAVLTRLGFRVRSGDITNEKNDQVWQRVLPKFASNVNLMLLDMKQLPFKTGSVRTITCMNTLHELESPKECVEEILRVHDRSGVLILGDFNDTGFETMQNLHRTLHGNDHPRGMMKIPECESLLRNRYSNVKIVLTPLNISFIASDRK